MPEAQMLSPMQTLSAKGAGGGSHEYNPSLQQISLTNLFEKTQDISKVAQAGAEDWLTYTAEFIDRAAIIPFSYEIDDLGRWTNKGRTVEEVSNLSGEDADVVKDVLEAEKGMMSDRQNVQALVASPDNGSGRNYLYVYTKDAEKPDKISALAIEYQGTKDELGNLLALLEGNEKKEEKRKKKNLISSGPIYRKKEEVLSVEDVFDAVLSSYEADNRKEEVEPYIERLAYDTVTFEKQKEKREQELENLAERIGEEILKDENVQTGIAAVAFGMTALAEQIDSKEPEDTYLGSQNGYKKKKKHEYEKTSVKEADDKIGSTKTEAKTSPVEKEDVSFKKRKKEKQAKRAKPININTASRESISIEDQQVNTPLIGYSEGRKADDKGQEESEKSLFERSKEILLHAVSIVKQDKEKREENREENQNKGREKISVVVFETESFIGEKDLSDTSPIESKENSQVLDSTENSENKESEITDRPQEDEVAELGLELVLSLSKKEQDPQDPEVESQAKKEAVLLSREKLTVYLLAYTDKKTPDRVKKYLSILIYKELQEAREHYEMSSELAKRLEQIDKESYGAYDDIYFDNSSLQLELLGIHPSNPLLQLIQVANWSKMGIEKLEERVEKEISKKERESKEKKEHIDNLKEALLDTIEAVLPETEKDASIDKEPLFGKEEKEKVKDELVDFGFTLAVFIADNDGEKEDDFEVKEHSVINEEERLNVILSALSDPGISEDAGFFLTGLAFFQIEKIIKQKQSTLPVEVLERWGMLALKRPLNNSEKVYDMIDFLFEKAEETVKKKFDKKERSLLADTYEPVEKTKKSEDITDEDKVAFIKRSILEAAGVKKKEEAIEGESYDEKEDLDERRDIVFDELVSGLSEMGFENTCEFLTEAKETEDIVFKKILIFSLIKIYGFEKDEEKALLERLKIGVYFDNSSLQLELLSIYLSNPLLQLIQVANWSKMGIEKIKNLSLALEIISFLNLVLSFESRGKSLSKEGIQFEKNRLMRISSTIKKHFAGKKKKKKKKIKNQRIPQRAVIYQYLPKGGVVYEV